jgi:hypothetical protein
MGDSWSCLSCIGAEEAPPPRKRIDRNMIGLPTNFRHTGHIGSSDLGSSDNGGGGGGGGNNINSVQTQMQSKGGYDHCTPVPDTATPSGQLVRSSEHS